MGMRKKMRMTTNVYEDGNEGEDKNKRTRMRARMVMGGKERMTRFIKHWTMIRSPPVESAIIPVQDLPCTMWLVKNMTFG